MRLLKIGLKLLISPGSIPGGLPKAFIRAPFLI